MSLVNLRKKMRQLGVRFTPIMPDSTLEFNANEVGYANANGATIGLVDESEPDRATHLVVRNVREAFLIMELMARFINDRDALNSADDGSGRKPFHYQSLEVDRLDIGPRSNIHVQFDNRNEDFHSWPTTTRHMSLPYRFFKIIRAVMSQQP